MGLQMNRLPKPQRSNHFSIETTEFGTRQAIDYFLDPFVQALRGTSGWQFGLWLEYLWSCRMFGCHGHHLILISFRATLSATGAL